MNILVYGVAADSGGALSVLMDFYKEFRQNRSNHYYFVISTPHIEDCENITVLRFPEVKKGWWYRLFFEFIKAPQLIKKYHIDEIFSTTNTVLPCVKKRQILYLHQSLPFVKYKFSLLKNSKFWIYQNVISCLIIHATQKADKVIVQTNWMKEAVSRVSKINPDKITISPPHIDTSGIQEYHRNSTNTFFYPAGAYEYKNHVVIISACKKLKDKGIENYNVIFTLSGQENKYARYLKEIVDQYGLPIHFVGSLPRKTVLSLYSSTFLLFPSFIETFGLPLLEARLSHAPIIAANTVFAREILSDYAYVSYFEKDDYIELSKEMEHIVT